MRDLLRCMYVAFLLSIGALGVAETAIKFTPRLEGSAPAEWNKDDTLFVVCIASIGFGLWEYKLLLRGRP